jgi:parallel beta-helix repeat protein
MGKVKRIIVLIILLILVQSVGAATITVCPSGCDHTTIQAAVNAASPGDTIQVGDGTYNENVDITKSLNIVSVNGSNVTKVNATNPADHVFYVTANNTNITGLTITGATNGTIPSPVGGIVLNGASNCDIKDNVLKSNFQGIILALGSNSNLVTGNNISLNLDVGLLMFQANNNNSIYNNFFSNNPSGNTIDSLINVNHWNTTKINGTNIIGGPFIGGNY